MLLVACCCWLPVGLTVVICFFVARCRSLFVVSCSLFDVYGLLFVAVCRMWLLVACFVVFFVRCLMFVASLF